MTPPTLHDLARKYREMLSLRDAHARGEGVASREVLRALSREFPGALREIDRLPMDALRERARLSEAAARGAIAPPAWLSIVAMYHGLYRDALRAHAGDARSAIAPRDGRRGPVIVSLIAAHFGLCDADVRDAIVPGDGLRRRGR